MATIYRCDRCGAEQNMPMLRMRTEIPSFPSGDLCKRCINAFGEWMKNFFATTTRTTLK
jgi:hypothetical protein